MTELVARRRPIEISDDLISAIGERRVIPFVGAGFSAVLGLPDWDRLLRNLCSDMSPDLNYDEIKDYANNDYLQIAEYLYIKSDRRIGPLRHIMEQGLNSANVVPSQSAAHIELANLGAPQIYTTNYDDLLERTYRDLGLPFSVVSLPKDVANLHLDTTQIIKYHGDLRHESTLVLTESAYYKRLDFESPMDLKFRSDLLGRSVLYMGYSFRDINIRLIWFKLSQMIQDIPAADRRPSYIVRVTPNPVLDELYRDVGLHTIVLDPEGRIAPKDRGALLGDFLGTLASRACRHDTIPGSAEPMFASERLMSRLIARYRQGRDVPRYAMASPWHEEVGYGARGSRSPFASLLARRIPAGLEELAKEAFLSALPELGPVQPQLHGALASKIRQFGAAPEVTFSFCRLLRGGSPPAHRWRPELRSSEEIPWDLVWGAKIPHVDAQLLLREFQQELAWNRANHADEDIAYLVDLLKRMVSGQILDVKGDEGLAKEGRELLDEAATLYPSISSYQPDPAGAPNPEVILAEVRRRADELPPEEEDSPWDDLVEGTGA